MKYQQPLIFAFMLNAYNMASAQPIEQTSDCWGAGNTMQQLQCFQAELEEAEKSLDAEYQRLNERNLHSEWVELRRSTCASESERLEGGTGAALIAHDCWIRMTKERVIELKTKSADIAGSTKK